MSKLTRKRQLAAAIESFEGVAETLSASEAGFLVEMLPQISFDPQMNERNPVRNSLSPIGKTIGKRPAKISFNMKLRGSGAVANEAKIITLLKACGRSVSDLEQITIGTITSGPFQHLETITGTTSEAVGTVICQTSTGTTTLYFITTSGTFQTSETITGGTSGATATTGSAPSDAGHVLLPINDSVPSLTLALYEDGVRKLLRGCRGSAKFNFSGGEAVSVDFTFQGVEGGITDTELLSSVSFESTVEPTLLGASFTVGSQAMQIGTMDIDLANTLAPRDDITDSRGLKSFRISGREPKGSMDPEMLAVATHDFYGSWLAGTKMVMDLSYGSTAGNKFRFYAPQVQYEKVDDGDKEGIQIAQTSFMLCSSGLETNDELAILFL